MGILVASVEAEQVYLQILRFVPVGIIPPIFYTDSSFTYRRCYLIEIRSIVKQNTTLCLSLSLSLCLSLTPPVFIFSLLPT